MSPLTVFSIKTVSAIVGLALCGFVLLYIFSDRRMEGPIGGACTEEALMCPDGSSVGREGASCAFSPCPDTGSFAGELRAQGGEYRLVISAPESMSNNATYALPLSFLSTPPPGEFIGKKVIVRGSFASGALFAVSSLEESEENLSEGTLRVGDTQFINGIKVTLVDVEDSRCPLDIQCVWVGNIVARISLVSDTDRDSFSLTYPGEGRAFDAYHVSILGVSPEPIATGLSQDTYRITFSVVSQ